MFMEALFILIVFKREERLLIFLLIFYSYKLKDLLKNKRRKRSLVSKNF